MLINEERKALELQVNFVTSEAKLNGKFKHDSTDLRDSQLEPAKLIPTSQADAAMNP